MYIMPYKFKFKNTEIKVPKNTEFVSHQHSWSTITDRPSSLPANGGTSAYANRLQGFYTGGGGYQPPSYFGLGGRLQMMNNLPNSNGGYYDCLILNSYISDVPICNMLAFAKNGSADIRHYAQNANNSAWTYQGKLAYQEQISDTGWVNCTLGHGISQYGSTRAAAQVRKIGNVVHLRGCVKNSTAWSEHTEIITIPSGYRPAQEEAYIMQGSGSNRFCVLIKTSGACQAERYSNNTTMSNTVSIGSWLNLCATWFVG